MMSRDRCKLRRADYDSFRRDLLELPRTVEGSAEIWSRFRPQLLTIQQRRILQKRVLRTKRVQPYWFHGGIGREVKKRKHFYHAAKINPIPDNKHERRLCTERRVVKRMMKQAKVAEKHRVALACHDNPNEFFGYVNKLKPRARLGPMFSSDGHLVTDDEDMAREYNNCSSSFLGVCLRAAEAGALGDLSDASIRHQGPGGPYTRHSKECRYDMPRGTTEFPRSSRPGDLLKQQGGNSILGFQPGGAGGSCGVGSHGHGDRGSVEAGIGERLETVEKNPGPRRGRRGKTAENRRARRERRYGRRRERREGRGRVGGLAGGGSVVGGAVMALMLMTVVTWNLQRVSLREQNRSRLRRVAEWVEQRGWTVVLVTELFGEGEGVIWMGENEHRTALVHGRKAGVLLRGTALLRWIEERQQKFTRG